MRVVQELIATPISEFYFPAPTLRTAISHNISKSSSSILSAGSIKRYIGKVWEKPRGTFNYLQALSCPENFSTRRGDTSTHGYKYFCAPRCHFYYLWEELPWNLSRDRKVPRKNRHLRLEGTARYLDRKSRAPEALARGISYDSSCLDFTSILFCWKPRFRRHGGSLQYISRLTFHCSEVSK